FAGTAEIARSAFKIGRQVGDAGLDHWIDDAFWREEGKSKGGVIPDGAVEARVPRGESHAARVGGTKIIRRVSPIEDRAVGMPSASRRVADCIGQNDRARRGVSDVPKSSGGLQVERAGRLEIQPDEIAAAKHQVASFERSGEAAAVGLACPGVRRSYARTRFRRGCSGGGGGDSGGGDTGAGAGAGPSNGIQSTIR